MSRLLRKIAFCSKTETVSGPHSDTECAVCQDQPVKPCTVPCGNHHVFCQACLQGLVSHNRYTTHFPCPLCRMHVRIPLGGVAAFRQGKGVRRHFLARIPVIRPRCRSPTDSVSSRWSDDLSLSGFDPGPNIIIPGGYSSASDDVDSLSSLGVPSEGAESLNVEAWLNSIDPEQVMFLEEIRRQRALAEDSQSADTVEELEAAGRSGTTAEEVGNGAGGRADQGDESSFRVPGHADWQDTVDIPAIPFPEGLAYGEDLDMTVVLQLIADMENRDRDNRHRAESTQADVEEEEEERGTEPHQEEKFLKSPCQVSSEATNEIASDVLYPDRPDEASDDTDWKLRTIASTAIPRPKVSLSRDMPEDGRSFSSEDEDGLELPLPQEVSADSPDLEDGVQEEQIFLDMLPPDAATDLEEEGMGHKETEICPDQESQLSDPDCPAEWNSLHSCALVSPVKAQTDTESLSAEDHKHNTSLTRSESSEDWNPSDFSFNLLDSNASTDHPHCSDETGGGDPSGDKSPEDWRRRELLRLQAAKLRRAAENPAEDLYLDTEVIISEGPNEWIRRIRSLQHRRRGPNSKQRVARSQSQGGKTECGERGVEKEVQERRRVEGRKGTADGMGPQKAIVGVEGEKGDLKRSAGVHGASYVRNLTVVHL